MASSEVANFLNTSCRMYFYIDNTPTHSYMKYLYKYPQSPFPYEQLVAENRKRNRNEREFELEDTGIFEGSDYFDVFVEYAKASTEVCSSVFPRLIP